MGDLLLLLTPRDVERTLAARIRAARKGASWTQEELARRAGLSVATIARLERTGQGQIASLTRVGFALGRLDDFEDLFRPAPPATLEALRALRRAEGR